MRRAARVAFYARGAGVAGVRAERPGGSDQWQWSPRRDHASRQPASLPTTFSRPPNTASFNRNTHGNWIHEDRSVKYPSDTCDCCV